MKICRQDLQGGTFFITVNYFRQLNWTHLNSDIYPTVNQANAGIIFALFLCGKRLHYVKITSFRVS